MSSEDSPRTAVMGLLNGAWIAQAVSTATRFHIPDLVAEHGPLSAAQLVAAHGVDARVDLLQRLLRACAAVGVFTEDAEGRFGPTERSAVLSRSSPISVKHFAELYGGDWWQSWGRLHQVVSTGQPAPEPWVTTDAGRVERFGEAMKSRVPTLRPLLARCDLSGVGLLVDVGGGFGHVAMHLLELHPELRACVVDLPDVIAIAERKATADGTDEIRGRLSFFGGDMFEKLPAGDAYLLSGVLHDWDDDTCLRLLKKCAGELAAGGRLICIDAVLPPLGDPASMQLKLMDLHMMVSLPGKERTEDEWRRLFHSTGFALERIVHPDPRRGASLIEGVRTR